MTTQRSSPAFVFCLCGHTGRRHEDGDGVCAAAGCGCTTLRPKPVDTIRGEHGPELVPKHGDLVVVVPEATGGPMPDTIRGVELEGPPERVVRLPAGRIVDPDAVERAVERVPTMGRRPSLLNRASKSPSTRIRKLGERIEKELAELALAVDHEDKVDEARREVERIDREHAERRAEILRQAGLVSGARGGSPHGEYRCPDCPELPPFRTGAARASHRRAAHPEET